MEEFCGSKFWDTQLTWNTSNPYFTPCFEKTVLSLLPILYFAIFGFISVLTNLFNQKHHSSNSDVLLNLSTRKRISILRYIKTVLSLGIVLTYVVKLLLQQLINQDEKIFVVDYVSPSILLIGFIFEIMFSLWIYTKRGIYSSGIQFVFWLLNVCTQVILFRTAIYKISNSQGEEGTNYLLRLIVFPLICIRFILEFIYDGNQEIKNERTESTPEERSTFFSKLFFLWYDKVAWTGFRRTITMNDLWKLHPTNSSYVQNQHFSKYWSKSTKSSKPGIIIPLIKAYGLIYAYSVFLKLTSDLLVVFAQPQLVKLLVNHVNKSESDEPIWKGYVYTIGLFLCAMFQSVLNNSSGKYTQLTSMRIRTALTSAVFRKSLYISNASKRDTTVGEIVNLMSVDSQKFVELLPFLTQAITAPIQIGFAIYFLYDTLGPSIFSGLAILLLVIPTNTFLGKLTRNYQMEAMKFKDERIKLMHEVMSGIKVLKLYGWELSFQKQLERIRDNELKYIRRSTFLSAASYCIFRSNPLITIFATFATYALSDSANVLNAEKTFVSMSLFNIIRMPMIFLPIALAVAIQTQVSIERLNKYLNMDEIEKDAITHEKRFDDQVVIENGKFAWTTPITTLSNINLKIKPGELVAVIGPIGSGKSSLLSAIIGDLGKEEGIVNSKGTLAYVAQSAWIQNATVRDNILFGDEFHSFRYNQILEACALSSDLAILPDGDLTEIGEKGINLSGGQKQRVALARAGYKKSSVYLLDDPLSAVDPHVGKHIFESLIGPRGILANTTRIFVTHGLNYLPFVDRIIVMKDGQITHSGTYQHILNNHVELSEFLVQYNNEPTETVDKKETMEVVEFSEKHENKFLDLESKTKPSKLVEDEVAAVGTTKFKVILNFFQLSGGKLSLFGMFVILLSNVVQTYSNIWLSNWSSQVTKEEAMNTTANSETTNYYVIGLGGLITGHTVTVIVGAVCVALFSMAGAKNIHSQALERVLRAPMSYFDTTLLGRLINKFSRELDVIDTIMPITFRAGANLFWSVMGSFVVISYTTPTFIGFIVPIGILYFLIQRFYVTTSRQLKRIDSISRSPIFAHFGETISGTSTIRAFGVEDMFITASENFIDINLRAYFPYIMSTLWMSVRLESIGALIILATCIFSLLSRDSLDPGSAGLAITYALNVTLLMNLLSKHVSDMENNLISVERITELTTQVPQEASWNSGPENNKPQPNWPSRGEIKFVNYSTRYRQGLDLVLKGIECVIFPGEKVGVVGRTGAGKSSLTLALFRIVEPVDGKIYIDGIDISTIGLHDLRKSITIIPQDPVLFSGTLRINLDPFEEYSDEQVWQCLELSHLKSYVVTLDGNLQYKVEEEGKNFSVGQRQLICLARALLRGTKILILDEATASVDLETDNLIQATIREEFIEATVITIAHRLNTILECDRIMVLENGKIKEFDKPNILLDDENSLFRDMAKSAKII